jgi:O-antigen ligase
VLALLALAPVSLGRLAEAEVAAWLLVVALAAALWLAGGGSLMPRRAGWPEWLLLAGLAASVVVTPFSVYLYDSLLALSLLVAAYLTYALCATALAPEGWNRAGWWSLAAGATVAGLWGAREYMTNAVLGGDVAWRAFGPFYNPNCLGGEMALVLAVPVALALGAQSRARRRAVAPRRKAAPAATKARRGPGAGRRAHPPAEGPEDQPRYVEIGATACAAVLGLGLLCTGSKGAFLAALASALVFAWSGAEPGTRLSRALRVGAALVVAAGLVGALAFPPIRARVLSAFGGQKESGSFRAYTWQGTADMVVARPLTGFGPGTFSRSYPRYARAGYTRQAHQTPLQLAAENGVPAALLLLAGMGLLTLGLARPPTGMPGRARLLAAAAAGGGVGFWLHNCVDYTWYVAALCAGYWGLLGLARGAVAGEAEAGEERRRPGLWALALVPVVVWAVVVLASQYNLAQARRFVAVSAGARAQASLARVLPLDAHRWVEQARLDGMGAALGREGAVQRAIRSRERAAALQPTEVTHWLALARLTLGEPARAEGYLREGLAVYPTSTEALAALVGVQRAQGQRQEALATARRLAALYDTPVRTVQAVQYFVDESYLAAWLPLAQEAARAHDAAGLALNAGRAVRTAAAWVRSQRDLKDMLQVARQYDPARIEQVAQVGQEAAALLAHDPAPLSRLRVALALGDLEDPRAGDEALTALAGSLAEKADAASRQVRAWALGGLAELRGRQKDTTGARAAYDQARAAGAQVRGDVTGKNQTAVPGLEAEEQAAYEALLATAPAGS